jgi:hypothetical protein
MGTDSTEGLAALICFGIEQFFAFDKAEISFGFYIYSFRLSCCQRKHLPSICERTRHLFDE